jgi:hypothetical protein
MDYAASNYGDEQLSYQDSLEIVVGCDVHNGKERVPFWFIQRVDKLGSGVGPPADSSLPLAWQLFPDSVNIINYSIIQGRRGILHQVVGTAYHSTHTLIICWEVETQFIDARGLQYLLLRLLHFCHKLRKLAVVVTRCSLTVKIRYQIR